jgi:hypothetical protein
LPPPSSSPHSGIVTVKGWWPYLWREWLTSVDHKRIGIMYVSLGLVMLLRGFADALMMRLHQALAIGTAQGYLPPANARVARISWNYDHEHDRRGVDEQKPLRRRDRPFRIQNAGGLTGSSEECTASERSKEKTPRGPPVLLIGRDPACPIDDTSELPATAKGLNGRGRRTHHPGRGSRRRNVGPRTLPWLWNQHALAVGLEALGQTRARAESSAARQRDGAGRSKTPQSRRRW